MNLRHIRDLVRLLEESGLTVLELQEADTRIRLEKSSLLHPQAGDAFNASRQAHMQADVQPPVMPPLSPLSDGGVDFNKIREVKSPLVGIFYSSPQPGAEPFVSVGGKVKKGDVLCVVEAMKMMNEITAEEEGELVDVCVQNGQVVEFGQVLFKIY